MMSTLACPPCSWKSRLALGRLWSRRVTREFCSVATIAFVVLAVTPLPAVLAQDAAIAAFRARQERLEPQIKKLDERGESTKADQLMQRLIDSARSTFGDEHPIYMHALYQHAMRLMERNELESLLAVVKELTPLIERHMQAEGASDMLALTLFATIKALPLDHPEGVDAAKTALRKLEHVLADAKPGDPRISLLVTARGRIARTTGDKSLVIANSRLQLAHRKTQDPDGFPTTYATASLALDLLAFGGEEDRTEVATLVEDASRRLGRHADDNTMAVSEVRIMVVRALLLLREFDRARPWIERIVATPVGFEPREQEAIHDREVLSEANLQSLNDVAIECRDARQTQLAIPLFRFVLAKRLERQPPDSVEVLRTQSGLGRSLIFEGQTKEGMELVSQAYETALKAPEKTASVIPALLLSRAVGLELIGARDEARGTYEEALAKAIKLEKDPQVAVKTRQLMAGAFADALDRSGHADEASTLKRETNVADPDHASSGP